jgi:hypothetical protein
MIFPKQTKWRKGILIKHKREMKLPLGNWMKIRTKAPNFALTKELNENTDKSTKFWLKIWQDWTLRSIQFCHANNKQVIMRCCSYNYGLIVLVIFGNFPNWTRPGGSWQNFQTSLVLLIPNCTPHRMITYTN